MRRKNRKTTSNLGKALKIYRQMHGCEPCKYCVIDNPGFKNDVYAVEVGKLEELIYSPPMGSRKNIDGRAIAYRHSFGKGNTLAVDHRGKLMLIGKAKVKKDGWIHG